MGLWDGLPLGAVDGCSEGAVEGRKLDDGSADESEGTVGTALTLGSADVEGSAERAAVGVWLVDGDSEIDGPADGSELVDGLLDAVVGSTDGASDATKVGESD